MIHCTFLNKQNKSEILPLLFELFYENMNSFFPSGESYHTQRGNWIAEISAAIDKASRQIILCYEDDRLVGFIMYYTRQDLLMVEELQIQKEYQRTCIFYILCSFLAKHLPAGVSCIEAFAHKPNKYSQKLMRRLGMQLVDDNHPDFVHYRGMISISLLSNLRSD